MIQSMTGFGSSQMKTADLEIEVTIKSLNGRFLEIRTHLPREYGLFERDVKSRVSAALQRGTVDVYISRRPRGSTGAHMAIDMAAARAWLKNYRSLGRELGLKGEPNLSQVMALPEVVSWQTTAAKASERQVVVKAVEKALEVCGRERAREGQALSRHLNQLLEQLGREMGRIENLADQTRQELGERLKERMARSPFGDKMDAHRLGQELAVYLERADIAEEVLRLKEHLKICLGLIRAGGIAGKKLDFYCQELHREVNTIGSKAPVAALTQVVVEAKSLIEQLKEQVQNIV